MPTTTIAPNKNFSPKKKLPHQPSDIKPEEIIEHEQEPPPKIGVEHNNAANNDHLKNIIKRINHNPTECALTPAEEDSWRRHHRELKKKLNNLYGSDQK